MLFPWPWPLILWDVCHWHQDINHSSSTAALSQACNPVEYERKQPLHFWSFLASTSTDALKYSSFVFCLFLLLLCFILLRDRVSLCKSRLMFKSWAQASFNLSLLSFSSPLPSPSSHFFSFFFLSLFFFAVLVIKLGAFHMLGKYSTTELHSQPFVCFKILPRTNFRAIFIWEF